jgi:hypothetical protein
MVWATEHRARKDLYPRDPRYDGFIRSSPRGDLTASPTKLPVKMIHGGMDGYSEGRRKHGYARSKYIAGTKFVT